MKIKTIALAAVVSLATFAFAENYTVKAVKGTVKAGTSTVQAGQVIQGETKLTAGLNSQLTVADSSGKSFVIKGKTAGTVADLVAKSSGGLKKGSLNTITVASAAKGGSKGVATASSRASEAKEDTDWAE